MGQLNCRLGGALIVAVVCAKRVDQRVGSGLFEYVCCRACNAAGYEDRREGRVSKPFALVDADVVKLNHGKLLRRGHVGVGIAGNAAVQLKSECPLGQPKETRANRFG